MNDTLIYTFYSYKGGVGRSMALANVAELFYQAGFKVLVVDWDLEAPGLDRFFVENYGQALSHLGLIDMLEDYKRIMAQPPSPHKPDTQTLPFANITPYCINLKSDKQNETGSRLTLMSAGKRDGDNFRKYVQSVLAFDWKDFYEHWEGELFFEWLRREFNKVADIVLIDSRTGVTEMGGACTYQMADVVVMFCTASEQSMTGTYRMATNFRNPALNDYRHGRPLRILIVPSRIDKNDSVLVDEFQQEFLTLFKDFALPELARDVRQFWNLNIPYVPKYAFKEKIAVRESSLASAEEIIPAFVTLAKAMVALASITDQKKFDDNVNKFLSQNISFQTQTRSIIKQSEVRVPSTFINRDDELSQILSSNAPAYYWVCAPTGYGKTALLKELERRFREDLQWLCAYVSVDLNGGLKELTTALAQELGITHWYESAHRVVRTSAGSHLGNALQHFWRESPEPGKGIALLIDFNVKNSNPKHSQLVKNLVREIWDQLIPEIQSALRSMKDFKENHTRFRVIMAGRPTAITYLSSPIRPLNLTPFTFNVIQSSVASSLSEADMANIRQFAAHLFYLTGGHPGCMAQILALYRKTMLPPDEWLDMYKHVVWQEIIRETVTQITDDVRSLPNIVDRFKYSLSVLRYLDQIVLGYIINSYMARNEIDEVQFEDELYATGLYDWENRFLRNAVSQRLLAIKLRNEEPQAFGTYSEQAQHICAQRLNDSRVQNPEKWVVEYLFQYLQSQTERIGQIQSRQQIKNDFFGTIVAQAIDMYVKTRNVQHAGWRTERQAIISEIEEDWEFQFIVNYYLRDDEYNNQPFKQLIDHIDATHI